MANKASRSAEAVAASEECIKVVGSTPAEFSASLIITLPLLFDLVSSSSVGTFEAKTQKYQVSSLSLAPQSDVYSVVGFE